MTDTLLLERTPAPTPLTQDVLDFAAESTKAVTNPLHAAFEVIVTPGEEWRPAVLHVFMHAAGKRTRIDDIPVPALPLQTEDHVTAVCKAYTKAYNALTVTFKDASERQMAGWSISGKDFVLKHKGEEEVLRHMAYAAGKVVHDHFRLGDQSDRARLVLNS